jgi:predicted GTPase
MHDEDMRPRAARALERIEELLEALPSKKAKEARAQLKQVREMLLEQRPPRLALVGRRGAGKSSLVNALFGEPIATVGHEKSQTGTPRWFGYESDRGRLELLDTRGFQEAHLPTEVDTAATPLDSVLLELEARCPDAVLFLVKASEAGAAMKEDLALLETLSTRLKTTHGTRVPIVAVITQCDLLEPKSVRLHAREDEHPTDYEEKIARVRRIERMVGDQLRGVSALKDAFVTSIGTSAYQSWRSDGTLRADERWNIDALVSYLYDKLPSEARLELVRIARVRSLQRKLARTVSSIVASACAAIAATPIPVGDIVPITSMQVALVASIGYIGGRSMSTRTAGEFLAAAGVNLGAGFAMREAARAVVKLLPIAGNLVSAAVAFAATMAIGEAAAVYFIDGLPFERAREYLPAPDKPLELPASTEPPLLNPGQDEADN